MRALFGRASPLLVTFACLARMSSTAAAAPATTASASVSGPMPSLFLAHGGGPCFFLKGGMFEEMDRVRVAVRFGALTRVWRRISEVSDGSNPPMPHKHAANASPPRRAALQDSVHADFYRKLNSKLPYKPTAILVISGHWEEAPGVKVQTGAKPPMLFDYYGEGRRQQRVALHPPRASSTSTARLRCRCLPA